MDHSEGLAPGDAALLLDTSLAITYSASTSACEKSQQWITAVRLLREMQQWNMKTDVITCNPAISACEEGPWKDYDRSLTVFEKRLDDEWKAVCHEWREKKCREKGREHREAFRTMPAKASMQCSVHRAFCFVKKTFDTYGETTPIPGKVWARLHDEIAGALAYGTFCGRRGEWEQMLLLDMIKVLEKGFSPKLRHTNRTHRVDIGSVHEVLQDDTVTIEYVDTHEQAADIFTKSLPPCKWESALQLLGITHSPPAD